MNRVTSKTVPNMGTVTYEYDIIEGVGTGETAERTTDPKGNITTKVYDRAGRLKAVIDGDITSTDITTYEYYANGSRKSVTYPTGIKEEYTYYPDNTLWTLTNKDADGTILDVYTYTYDHANNQTSKHEVINGIDKGTTSYVYDGLNRLLTVTEPSGRETGYTYDMAGNRTMELISSGSETISNIYSYNEQNRLVYITTQVDSELTEKTEYCYDHNGNQLETIVTEYIDGVAQTPVTAAVNTYDSKNQLIETVTADGTTLTNAYNGEGLRVSKTVNGQTTTFLYEYNKVVLEINADGTEKARNLYGTNLLMRTVDSESYYYLYNGHADVTALIDTDGSIAATYYYDAFGNILEQTGDVDNNITYAGYQYDDETGLYYLNARMYDPKIARFLQEDTYRGDPNDPLSLNLYTYCANNPLIYFDPTGHDLWKLSTLLSYAEGEMYEKNGILYITANGISREYSKDELFNYEGEYIIDDDLFRLDFNYHKSFFDFFKKKLRLDDNNNDIRSLNKYEYTLENFRNASGYGKLYESTVLYYEGFIEDYGLVGYYFAASKEDDLYRLFNKKGPYFSEREAYSLGLTEFGATALELTYKSNKLGYSFAEMEREYQEPKQAERNALLAMMAFSIAVGNEKMPSNTNYLGRGPKDPEYYIVNNERVYYERPSGYIFESDPKFALDGSQTAFSVLYPDGRLLWDEGASSTAPQVQTTRVGRWMSQAEYDAMVKTGKVQMSPNGNTTYVANPANLNAFKAAPNGSIYVEFDVPTNSIYPAGNTNWGQIAGPGSLMDRLNQSKGLPPISGMPDATNIKIIGGK